MAARKKSGAATDRRAAPSGRRGGTLVLVGGGEFRSGCRALDADLVARSGVGEVVVLPTAAAFEHPDRVGERAAAHFGELGATVHALPVLHRGEAEEPQNAEAVRAAKFVYVADGSPLHLRSVLKDSALFDALLASYHGGGVLAASGAGATVLCDPMVDPRGGAYTVGLGIVRNLAVFPYHGTAADHLRERSIDLLPPNATLVGVDEETALVRDPDGTWRVAGSGHVTVYAGGSSVAYRDGAAIEGLPAY
ncbi:MAG TPA: Type 1 glutamine amidotransferase-like domain-containing protein [Acidimicrobiia bacterium]|nr:Type 1 glutamine amidotransferase-like domain-containing protein [Acidimicrobiia bacterium]